MRVLISSAAVLALMLAASTGALAAAPAKSAKTEKGEVLVDAKGMTLYVFDKDMGGKSACNDNCATNWPPLMAESGAKAEGKWTIIKRDDGKMQWAHGGKPLYTFIKDKKAGDISGDGVNGVWHLAKP